MKGSIKKKGNELGAAFVEAALSFALLILICITMLDITIFVQRYGEMTREGLEIARHLSVRVGEVLEKACPSDGATREDEIFQIASQQLGIYTASLGFINDGEFQCSSTGCYQTSAVEGDPSSGLPYISIKIEGRLRNGGVSVYLANLIGIKTTQRAIVESYSCTLS